MRQDVQQENGLMPVHQLSITKTLTHLVLAAKMQKSMTVG